MTQKEFASLGGKARSEKLTPERRSEIAKNAVQARIDKAKKLSPDSIDTCLQDNNIGATFSE